MESSGLGIQMSSSGQAARESNVQLPGAVFTVLSQLPHLY